MTLDIRYAGLEQDVERRVSFAVNGLAAHGVQARATAWDGTRCDLLVTDIEDTYGRIAADIARRRDTPTLAFTSQANSLDTWASWLGRDATVTVVTRALLGMLPNGKARAPAPAAPVPTATDASVFKSRAMLVRLVLEPGLRRARVRLGTGKHWLLADPQTGRLHAAHADDIVSACTALSQVGGEISLHDNARMPAELAFATSLDAAYVQAALHRNSALPAFPLHDVWLCDWPDLGHAPEHVDALLVARMLLRGKTDAEGIASATGVPLRSVNATLWAFAASGILHHASLNGDQASLPRSSVAGRFGQLAARMARHFGLRARA